MQTRNDPFSSGRRPDFTTDQSSATAVLEPPPQPPVLNPALAATLPAATPKKGLKKLSFGGIAVKKEETKTAYPVYDNAEAALIAARIKQRQADIEALEGALAVDKAELKQSVGLFYFQTNHGRHEVPSSISVPSAAGEVLVCFQNRYPALESEDPILAVLGEDLTVRYFAAQDKLTIDCEKLPLNAAQEFVDELQQLVAKYSAAEALTVKSSIKPVADFHLARHSVLSVAQNMLLEAAYPIVAMIKTKGRGEKK